MNIEKHFKIQNFTTPTKYDCTSCNITKDSKLWIIHRETGKHVCSKCYENITGIKLDKVGFYGEATFKGFINSNNRIITIKGVKIK